MMCAAAVQAAHTVEKGIIELDPEFSKWLDAEFRGELGDEAGLLPT